MECKNRVRLGMAVHPIHFVILVFSMLGLLAGCGSKSDDRFAAESYDQSGQPSANAVIGTPEGVITIGADGGVTSIAPPPSGGATSAGSSAVSVGASASGSGGSSVASGVGTAVATGTATSISTSSSSAPSSSSASSGASVGSSSSGIGIVGDAGSVSEDAGTTGGFGFWHFDDCSPNSHFLLDSSGEGANAVQALGADCVPGISGLGVDIHSAKEVIQVPDEPQFTLTTRVGVAAWVHPNTVSGDQPIVIKRLNDSTAFSLGIHDGNIQMSVVLTTGTTVISQAPISAGVWTHVAGMFDGTFVYLFINGQQFGQVYGAGTIRDVFAPLRFGATTQTQHLDGILDEVFVTTEVISASTLTALACIPEPSTLTVSPTTSGPVPIGTTVGYDVAVTDNDIGFCAPREYSAFFSGLQTDIVGSFNPSFVTVQPGSPPPSSQSATLVAQVTSSEIATPGTFQVPFIVDDFNESTFTFEELTGQVTYELVAPSGCFVSIGQELMITDTSIVDDPVRTLGQTAGEGVSAGGDGGVVILPTAVSVADAAVGVVALDPATGGTALLDGSVSPSQGVWTLGQLLSNAAPTPDQAPAMTLALFQHWLTDQTVNGFDVPARTEAQQLILDIWPKTATGDLDLTQAPFTLQAIVARVDLRNLAAGSAGEGRFVFGLNGPFGFPQLFTLILEYNLPAQTQDDVVTWANRWHSLSSYPFPSEQYNAALETITTLFTSRGALPSSTNGSALLSLRTNDFALVPQWELREFELDPTTGLFDQNPTKETPDLSFNGTQTFADFVNQNAASIIAEIPGASGNNVTLQFEGVNFQAGSSINQLPSGVIWNAPGILDPDARFHASENTCNGCHGSETGTAFLQVTPRSPGAQAPLSPFLTGTTVVDPVSGQVRTLNDLQRRQTDLESLVCPSDGGVAGADAGAVPPVVDASPALPTNSEPPPVLVGTSPPVLVGTSSAP